MLITVFTPTYNRGYIIGKLYESLTRQTFHDFEWLIVDDGSSDNTEKIVKGFIARDNFFPIRYIKTTNGGKHRAINRGVWAALGDLFFIVDSDDSLPDNGLEIVRNVENSIAQFAKANFAGICGQRYYNNGKAIGTSFGADYVDATTLEKRELGISGDKAEVYYTCVLRKYPFPEFDGEKFCTESIVWDRISYNGLKLRYFNKNIYLCDYLDDGLTRQGYNLYANNPQQWGLSIWQDYKFGKTNLFEKNLEVYKFYLLTRHVLCLSDIAKYTNSSLAEINTFIVLNKIADFGRRLIGKLTIKDSLLK